MNINHILYLIVLFIIGHLPYSFSQNYTSKTELCQSLLKRAQEQTSQRQYDSAIITLEDSLLIHKTSLSDTLLLEAYNELGVNHYMKKNYATAIKAYQSSLNSHRNLGTYYPIYQVYTIKNVGMVYRKMSKYDSALNYFLAATDLLDIDDDTHQHLLGESYGLIGNIYRKLKKDSLSITYHKKALMIWKTLKDSTALATSLHNLGLSERKLGNYTTAINYFHQALTLKKKQQLTRFIPSSISNLGDVYYFQHQYDSALYFYKQAYQLRDSINDQSGKAITLNNLAATYLATQNFTQAQQCLKLLASFIDQIKNINTIKEYHLTQATYLFAVQEMKLGNKHLRKYQALQDSIYNQEMTEQVADAETKYKTKEKEQQLTFEKDRAETNAKINYLLGAVVFLVFVGIVFIWRSNRKINKQKNFIENLMRELHHRIKNNFATFSGLLSIQRNRTPDQETKIAIQEIENRLQSLSSIHQKLYHGSQPNQIHTKEYLTDLVEKLIWTYNFPNLKPNFKLIDIELVANQALILGFLVNEVVTNTLKYAYEGISNPQLIISMQLKKNDYFIKIQDNGIGFQETHHHTQKSYGTKLIEGFTKQLKGEYSYYSSDEGTTFELQFPKTKLPS